MIRLELPNIKYKKTYINAVKEFQNQGPDERQSSNFNKLNIKELEESFDKYIQKIERQKTENQPEGRVPETKYWIIDENEKYCGTFYLRHELNEHLEKFGGQLGYSITPSERRKGYATQALKLGLEKAKKIGINKLLITCDDDNIASIRVIEKSGGKLHNKIKQESGVLTRRYFIEI